MVEDLNNMIRTMISSVGKPNSEILHLLFTNHRQFPDFKTSSGKRRLCFIEIENQDHKVQECCTNSKNEIFSQMRIFSSLVSSLQNAFDLNQFNPDSLKELLEQKERLSQERRVDLIPYIEENTKNSILALIAEPLIENWQMQSEILRQKNVLKTLKNLDAVKQWFRLGICSQCPDFQLIIGEFNHRITKCPKCKHKQCEITIYVFDEEFSEWKLDDNDLPHFIFEYVSIETANKLQLKLNKKIDSVEIDCYLPNTKLGIECKQFVHKIAPSQDTTQLKSDIVNQLKRYQSVGVKRVLLVINIQDGMFSKIKDDIIQQTKTAGLNFDSFSIVNNPSTLILELKNEIMFAANTS